MNRLLSLLRMAQKQKKFSKFKKFLAILKAKYGVACLRSFLRNRLDFYITEKSVSNLQLVKWTMFVRKVSAIYASHIHGECQARAFELPMVHQTHTELESYEYIIRRDHGYPPQKSLST